MEFKSSLGDKHFEVPQPKVFTVTDESGFQNEAKPSSGWNEAGMNLPGVGNFQPGVQVNLSAEQLSQMRESIATQQKVQAKHVPQGARERIDLLTGLGRKQTVVEIEGHSFTLRSLKNKENQEVMQVSASLPLATDVMFAVRSNTLARSLLLIDNMDVNLVIGSNRTEDRLAFIEGSEESTIATLFNAYSEMVKDKNLTEGQVKEVVENIKK